MSVEMISNFKFVKAIMSPSAKLLFQIHVLYFRHEIQTKLEKMLSFAAFLACNIFVKDGRGISKKFVKLIFRNEENVEV